MCEGLFWAHKRECQARANQFQAEWGGVSVSMSAGIHKKTLRQLPIPSCLTAKMPSRRHGTPSLPSAHTMMASAPWPSTTASQHYLLPLRMVHSNCGTFRRQSQPRSKSATLEGRGLRTWGLSDGIPLFLTEMLHWTWSQFTLSELTGREMAEPALSLVCHSMC